jgi:hypothetical protein
VTLARDAPREALVRQFNALYESRLTNFPTSSHILNVANQLR